MPPYTYAGILKNLAESISKSDEQELSSSLRELSAQSTMDLMGS